MGRGGGGRGHFIHLAIYCITTWCFALKGLRTIMYDFGAGREVVLVSLAHPPEDRRILSQY